ncbi:Putative metal-dependent hydrolase [Idiomarina sp. A28L]|uniref:M48 family metallopeptidase n=1 Tax=Idiomarina sp. A28L TaxID=1036674 RepID=UPI00021389B6|nr:SprT family zinc-dependent metalloprotease [Idiomarina sp. A28L]EGN74988.1 Putative metal-dependent hydrolase [Idiomarina sp. A28L]
MPLSTTEHTHAGIYFSLTRKRMKNIRLRVLAPTGEVKVSAPHRARVEDVLRFIAEKQEWIRQHQQRISEQALLISEPEKDLEPLREPMRQRISELLLLWEPRMQVKASSFGIRNMKTRWGSCNIRTKKIWLSLALAAKEPDLLEYVLVHELVHLLEAGHNARFYRFMDEFMPNWREKHQRLNPNARIRL